MSRMNINLDSVSCIPYSPLPPFTHPVISHASSFSIFLCSVNNNDNNSNNTPDYSDLICIHTAHYAFAMYGQSLAS